MIEEDLFPRYAHEPAEALERLPWAGAGGAIEGLRADLEAGAPWYPAVLRAIERWDRPDDVYEGRFYAYLIADEAFDWLALVERFYAELGRLMPADEVEALLFYGRPPGGFNETEFQLAIGEAKYRTYLNYFYGVVVEEALLRSVEEVIMKERLSGLRSTALISEEVAERVYGLPQATLLERFRAEQDLAPEDAIAYIDWKAFTYWCFKFRVRYGDRARVAADTKRGIDTLNRLRQEALSGLAPDPEPVHANAIDLAPYRYRVVR